MVVRESMTDATARRLRDWIVQYAMAEGDRLPPETELAPRLGVSRTVLREAVARLQAQGELISRRGSGVFVGRPAEQGLRLAPGDRLVVEDILGDLELRVALEVEASGLAARRRSSDHIAAMQRAMAEQAVAAGREAASAADFAFHRAIAIGSGNPRFVHLLDQMGLGAIPRSRLQSGETTGPDYAAQLEAEHRAILDAIVAQDPAYARDAMRLHLSRSMRRYQHAVEAT